MTSTPSPSPPPRVPGTRYHDTIIILRSHFGSRWRPLPPSALLLLPRYKGAGGKTTLVCQIPAHDIGLLNHNAFAEQGPTRVLARAPKPRRFGRWLEWLGELEKRQWSMVSGETGWRPRQQPRAELRGVVALRRNAEASRQLLQRCGSDRCGGRPS